MAATNFTPISLYYSTTAATAPVAGNLVNGELAINITDGKLYYKNNSGVVTLLASTLGASGDVVGPASATDNALARFDLTTGKLIQNSVGILSDAGILTGLTGLTSSGSITLSSLTSGRVTYATTAGLLTDSANLTFNGTTLTANTIGAYTLSGTIAGGGNQINNVIIGTSTPLAGSFTTINASTSITNAGLTSGRVTYAGASGLLSDSAGLTYDGTNLTTTGTATATRFIPSGSTVATNGMFLPAANTLGFSTNSTRQMTISSLGYLGIGVSSPTQPLQIGNAVSVEIDSLIAGTRTSTLYTDNSQFIIETATNINMIFNTNATQRMVITGAGLVGIGTSSPNNNLEVYSSSNPSIALTSTSASLYSYFGMTSGTVGAQLYTFGQSYSAVYPAGSTALANDTYGIILNASNASGILRFQTNATERMRITSDGNVGIGYTTPEALAALVVKDKGNTGTIALLSSTESNILYIKNNGTSINFNYNDAYPIIFTNAGGERLRITSAGLVGIGTSSPSAPLDILSTTSNPSVIVRTGTSDCIVSFKNTGSGGREYWIDSGGTGAGVGAGNLAFYDATASATRMVIDAGGNLIVGAISTVGSGGKAQVYSTADTLYVQSNVNAPYSAIIANVQYTACNLIAFQYSNPLVNVGAISTNGTITVYGTTSDYRLKENIVPMTGALATVAQLKPVTYKWKSDGSDGQGFIAHELQAVVPDAVHGEKDAVDADGNPVYQNVDTSHLIATLTAAIQEQQALIESLTTRITNLENK